MKKIGLGNGVVVNLPPINYFIDKISSNDPFHFLKVNHGFLDLINHTYPNLDKLDVLVSGSDYKSIVSDLYKKLKSNTYPIGENIKYYNGTSENVYNGLNVLLNLYTKNSSNKIHIGISKGVGLDYTFGEYSPQHPIQKNRGRIVNLLLNKNTNYFHSGVLKHFCIMGELQSMFDKLNQLEFDVIFIGTEYFKQFEEIYSIKKFHHIEIPQRFAIDSKDEIIKSIYDIHNGKTILFHSTGHLLSAELAYELEATNIFGFDVGRSFDWDVKEYIEPKRKNGKYDWINAKWMTNHKKIYKDYINSLRR